MHQTAKRTLFLSLSFCQLHVRPPVGHRMAVKVERINCNVNPAPFIIDIAQVGEGLSDIIHTMLLSHHVYCRSYRKSPIAYSAPNAIIQISLRADRSMPIDLLLNLTSLPEFQRLLTVELTSPLNEGIIAEAVTVHFDMVLTGFVSTPGWDSETIALLTLDTWTSVVIPADHGVMVSVIQLDCSRHMASFIMCSGCHQLALHEDRYAKPVKVYCMDVPTPVFSNSTSGNILFHYVTNYGYFGSWGFRFRFSFHPPSSRLVQLSDGTWNCSVPNWSEFRHHFPCNWQTDCAGGEDEAVCPYTTAHCGSGRVDLEGFCYVFISAKKDEPDWAPWMSWDMAEERCKQEGGHLASLNSHREMQVVMNSIDETMVVFIGLIKSGNRVPFIYQWTWMYLDETVAHFFGAGVSGSSAYIRGRSFVGTERDDRVTASSGLCEVAASAPGRVSRENGRSVDEQTDNLVTTVNQDFPQTLYTVCPQGHVTHTFLACDADSACWARDFHTSVSGCGALAPFAPSMACDNGVQNVPYTLVCDHRPDCSDRSDEDFCVFSPCDLSTQSVCLDKTCLPSDAKCNGVQDCLDASDELPCRATSGESFRPSTQTKDILHPAILNFDGTGNTYLSQLVGRVAVNGTPVDAKPVCPDTHFQCPVNEICVPVFTRCNDVYDCPGHEDEAGCDSYTCPGFYRCRGSRICLHEDDVCDGIFHCPQGDDERLCGFACPVSCTCYGLAFVCPTVTSVSLYPELRYLDASSSGMKMADVKNSSWLVYLNLVHCGVAEWALLNLPNLRFLDLAHNNVSVVSAQVLQQLPNLRHLALAHNPLTSFLSHSMTPSSEPFPSLRSLDVSGVLLIDVSVLAIFTSLHVLNLTGCGIDRLPEVGFRLLMQLRVLDLRGCPLTFFPRNVFLGLDDLTAVYADNYKLCCPATLPDGSNLNFCQAPTNEVSSCESLLRSNIFRISLYVFAILACVGNVSSLIFRIVSSTRKFKTGFDIFVSTLCVSDFLMGVYLAVIGVADRVYLGTYLWEDITWRHSTACKVAGFLSLLSNEMSAFMITLITLDRFLVLRFPFKQLRFTRNTALLASGVGWVVGLAIATVPLLSWNSDWQFYSQMAICIPLPITRQDFAGHDYAFSVMIVLNFVLFVFIAVGQFFVYMSVQTHKMPANSETSTAPNKDRTLARRLITVAVSDFLCWFPVGLMAIMAANGFPVPGQVNVAMAVFVMPLNSAINPFLYTLNIVLEKRRLERERRLQHWLLSRTQPQSARSGTSTLCANRVSQQEAERHLRVWLQKGVLSPEHVLLSLQEGQRFAADTKRRHDNQ